MANEFIARNGIIAKSDSVISGSLTVTGIINGTITGSITSASIAVTSSFAESASLSNTASYVNPLIQPVTVTGSLNITGSTTTTSLTASAAVVGDLAILGTASISYLNVTYQSSSIIYSTGSNQFGDALDDTQSLYGTVKVVTGSLQVTGSVSIINGSLTVTANSNLSNRALLIEPSSTGTAVVRHNRSNTTSIGTYEFLTGGFLKWAIGLRELGDDNYHIYNQGTGADALTIKRDNGYVGIGTLDPSASLDVAGLGRFTSGLSVTGSLLVTGSITSSQDIQVNGINFGRGPGTLPGTQRNIAIGNNNFSSSIRVTGNNIAIGNETLSKFGSNGYFTVAIGGDALKNSIQGDYGVAIGHTALFSATSSNDTIGIGAGAFFYHQNPYAETAIGHLAAQNLRGGFGNFFGGAYAGGALRYSEYSVGVGYYALNSFSNETSSFNTAIGYNTAAEWKSGSYNTWLGNNINAFNSGSYNTIIGGNIPATSIVGSGILNKSVILADGSGSIRLYSPSSSNVLFGGLTDSGHKVQVYGTTLLSGSVTSSQDIQVNSINIGRGGYSGSSALGYNIAIGEGNFNTAAATLSRRNIALGGNALQNLSTGYESIAIGNSALKNSSTDIGNIAIGQDALLLNNGGNYNVSVGYQSMQANLAGQTNTAIGYQALKGNISGDGNTAVGNAALQNNKFGRRNTAVGDGALGILTLSTGSNNTVLGYSAGVLLYSGSYNTIIGSDSYPFSSGSNNTILGARLSTGAVGPHRLENTVIISDGAGSIRFYSPTSSNVIFGGTIDTGEKLQVSGSVRISNGLNITGSTILSGSLLVTASINISGSFISSQDIQVNGLRIGKGINNDFYSIVIGRNNFSSSYSGYANVAIGDVAGANNTDGTDNIYIGFESGIANRTGDGNIIMGSEALRNGNNTGYGNIAIGDRAGRSANFGNENTALGAFALNQLPGGNGNIALGSYTLQDITRTGSFNTALGYWSGRDFKSGSYNIFIGNEYKGFRTGSFNTIIGGSIPLGTITDGTSNSVVLADGSGSIKLFSTSNGNVALGSYIPTAKLHVSGSPGTGSALLVQKSGSTVFDVQGSQGQLFSVVDSLSGSLMSVNDVSGLPILEVFSDDRVEMGTYGATALVVSASRVSKLLVSASAEITGSLLVKGNQSISGSISFTAPGDSLYSAGGGAFYRPSDAFGNTYAVNYGGGYYGDFTQYVFRNQVASDLATINGTTGHMGIGNSSPGARLTVKGSGTTSSTTALRIENANASGSLIVLDNGNVGIGTIAPSASLQVGAFVDSFASGLSVAGSQNIIARSPSSHHNWLPYADGNNYFSAGSHTFRNQNMSGVGLYVTNTFTGVGTNTNAGFAFDVNGSARISSGLTVTGSTVYTGSVSINGVLTATVKSFLIDHPTQPNKKLQYGNLEGPEHGVYFRGKSESNTIELPEEWTGLVDESTITVQLTPIGTHQQLYVEKIHNNTIHVNSSNWLSKSLNYFYLIHAERKDVSKLITVI